MSRIPALPRSLLPRRLRAARAVLAQALPACLVAVILLSPAAARADVYTWRDPQTGGKRMSNIPPRWVVENTVGPRVEVMRGSSIIDLNKALASPQEPAQPSAQQRARGAAAAAAHGRTVEAPPPPEPEEGD